MNLSINLTIHNKGYLLPEVLAGIKNNTVGQYELITVIDGCTDSSLQIVEQFKRENPKIKTVILEAPNVFETRSNNKAAKESYGDHIIIIQDDMVINEKGYNERLLKPFKQYDDVFAVTGRCAHNWEVNQNSIDINKSDIDDKRWCDILNHVDHANKENTNSDRDYFHIRDSVNRGPLAINRMDLQTMNYFSEDIFKQDMDDHLLMFDMHLKLGKVCGYYNIDFTSKNEWGGTRNEFGAPKQWLLESHHKNTRLFYERHKETIKRRKIESRICK